MAKEKISGNKYPLVLMSDMLYWKAKLNIYYDPSDIAIVLTTAADMVEKAGIAFSELADAMILVSSKFAEAGESLHKALTKGLKEGKTIEQIQKEVLDENK